MQLSPRATYTLRFFFQNTNLVNTKREKSSVNNQLEVRKRAVKVVEDCVKRLPQPVPRVPLPASEASQPASRALDPEKDLDLVGKPSSTSITMYSYVKKTSTAVHLCTSKMNTAG